MNRPSRRLLLKSKAFLEMNLRDVVLAGVVRRAESLRGRMGLVTGCSLQGPSFQSGAGKIRHNQPHASKESPHDSSSRRRKTIL